jgi:hypothetical protein
MFLPPDLAPHYARPDLGHVDAHLRFLPNYPFPKSVVMELLLNLAWLLLALPAYWLWSSSRTGHKFSSLQCLLALGCVLVILFPVVSATDDLCAMRNEMEESPASKRSVRPASPDKVPLRKLQSPPALAADARSFLLHDKDGVWWQSLSPSLVIAAAPAIKRAGRSPPDSLLFSVVS